MARCGFIGCGNLAQAIIGGLIHEKSLAPADVTAFDVDVKKMRKFSLETGIRIGLSVADVVHHAEIVFLATKPQDIMPLLTELSAPSLGGEAVLAGKTVVSLAAGVPSKMLLKYCGGARTVVRVMANTAAAVQKAVFGIYFAKKSDYDADLVSRLFGSIGSIVVVDSDDKINAVTSGSASGIGFVVSFMEEYEKWFVAKGFSKKEARSMTVETFLGASYLARAKSELSLGQIREMVTSKKGTTFAGLAAMKKAKIPSGLRSGLDAAFRRSREIAKDLLRGKK